MPSCTSSRITHTTSRQALYLHFTDRTTLFLEVSRIVDASLRTAARQRRVDDAPTARAALHEAVALQAWLKRRLKGVATALDVGHDPAGDVVGVRTGFGAGKSARCRGTLSYQ